VSSDVVFEVWKCSKICLQLGCYIAGAIVYALS